MTAAMTRPGLRSPSPRRGPCTGARSWQHSRGGGVRRPWRVAYVRFPVRWGFWVSARTSMGESAGVSLKGIGRSFGVIDAIRRLSLHIEEGETVGLLGPNGDGKT